MNAEQIEKNIRDRIAEIDAQTIALAAERSRLQGMLNDGARKAKNLVDEVVKRLGHPSPPVLIPMIHPVPVFIPTVNPVGEWVCGFCGRRDCLGTHVWCNSKSESSAFTISPGTTTCLPPHTIVSVERYTVS